MSEACPGAEPVEVVGEVVRIDGRALLRREDEIRVRPRWARCESLLSLPCSVASEQTVERGGDVKRSPRSPGLQPTQDELRAPPRLLRLLGREPPRSRAS